MRKCRRAAGTAARRSSSTATHFHCASPLAVFKGVVMSRIPLVVGNWKMHKTIQETVDFCRLLREELSSWPEGPVLREKKVEVAVAPPFTNLSAAAQALQGS